MEAKQKNLENSSLKQKNRFVCCLVNDADAAMRTSLLGMQAWERDLFRDETKLMHDISRNKTFHDNSIALNVTTSNYRKFSDMQSRRAAITDDTKYDNQIKTQKTLANEVAKDGYSNGSD